PMTVSDGGPLSSLDFRSMEPLAAAIEQCYLGEGSSLTFVREGGNRTFRFRTREHSCFLRESAQRWTATDVLTEARVLAKAGARFAPQLEPLRGRASGVYHLSEHVFALNGRYYWATQSLSGLPFFGTASEAYSLGGVLAHLHQDLAVFGDQDP